MPISFDKRVIFINVYGQEDSSAITVDPRRRDEVFNYLQRFKADAKYGRVTALSPGAGIPASTGGIVHPAIATS